MDVRAGKYKAPLDLERLQSDPYIEFSERSEIQNVVPNRDTGLELHGDLIDNRLTYQLALMNGVPNNTASVDIDNNDGKDSKDSYDSSNQNGDSSVAAAQERLSKQGYYRGQIDGVFGPETRRAILRYQSDHGLGATGYLTMETRQSLGLRQGAGN